MKVELNFSRWMDESEADEHYVSDDPVTFVTVDWTKTIVAVDKQKPIICFTSHYLNFPPSISSGPMRWDNGWRHFVILMGARPA